MLYMYACRRHKRKLSKLRELLSYIRNHILQNVANVHALYIYTLSHIQHIHCDIRMAGMAEVSVSWKYDSKNEKDTGI